MYFFGIKNLETYLGHKNPINKSPPGCFDYSKAPIQLDGEPVNLLRFQHSAWWMILGSSPYRSAVKLPCCSSEEGPHFYTPKKKHVEYLMSSSRIALFF